MTTSAQRYSKANLLTIRDNVQAELQHQQAHLGPWTSIPVQRITAIIEAENALAWVERKLEFYCCREGCGSERVAYGCCSPHYDEVIERIASFRANLVADPALDEM